jgi:hypothetical protein
MTSRLALALVVACWPATLLCGQGLPQVPILVSSCPAADSIFGPRATGSPLILRGGQFDAGEVRIGLPSGATSLRYGEPFLQATVSAYPAPTAIAPRPAELLLTLTGDPARQLTAMEQPVAATLRLKADTVPLLGTFPRVTGTPAQGTAIAFVSFPLEVGLIARIAAAKDARLELGHTRVDLSKDLRRQLGDAYRAALCGYQPSH